MTHDHRPEVADHNRSLNHALDAVPRHIDIAGITKYLLGVENVSRIHDLHVWPLSTTETALTVHLVVTGEALDNNFLQRLQRHLYDHSGIAHATIQIESSLGENHCMLDRQ
ncbi:MAG TPA: cation transporter [Proteobacteria bacterium]|nr:cation transporter [Pseudomonadota bacterium]